MTDEELIRWTWENVKGTITTFPRTVPAGKTRIIFSEYQTRWRTKILGTIESSGKFIVVRD